MIQIWRESKPLWWVTHPLDSFIVVTSTRELPTPGMVAATPATIAQAGLGLQTVTGIKGTGHPVRYCAYYCVTPLEGADLVFPTLLPLMFVLKKSRGGFPLFTPSGLTYSPLRLYFLIYLSPLREDHTRLFDANAKKLLMHLNDLLPT